MSDEKRMTCLFRVVVLPSIMSNLTRGRRKFAFSIRVVRR